MTFKLGILASGNGTDLDAIYEEIDAGKMVGIEVGVVLSDKEKSPALEKARARGIRAEFVDPVGKSREDYDAELVRVMGPVDLVCLVGYMRILSSVFVRAYSPRHIINVHPALLPKYGGNGWYGMKVHEAVLANKETESGMTIHYVDYGVDSGPTVLQQKVPVLADDTPASLKARVQELEKKAYPEAIRLIAAERSASFES